MLENKEIVWYALRATYSRVINAKKILDDDDVENFIPQHYQIQKTKNGHNEKVLVPFLKDLIFVRSTQEKIKEEKSKIPYLLYITKREGDRNRPIIVPDREMNNFIDAIKVFNENLIFLKP